ncbi:MAG: hypothetical protein LQ342_000622 [Letrouitia transgressa]|nr:MAG: hypothetical protein LQ342_000622 [Letrouitia transgressa]
MTTALPALADPTLLSNPSPPPPPHPADHPHDSYAPTANLNPDPEAAIATAAPPISSNPSHRSSLAPSTSSIPWGPSHPCFPHPNPHVPLSSPLYASTRIIRIPRDWMIAADLAPTFSNIYPEILEPWVSESDFRVLVNGVNEGLVRAFKPDHWRNAMDAVLGVATGWLWEDLGGEGIWVKNGVRGVEREIERWNKGRGEDGVKAVGLRKTGFMSLDIQIPDPHVRVVGEGGEEEEHAGHGTGEGGNDAREEEAQADGGTERNSGAN